MLDEERPDVVHICTPHHLHAPMAIESLRRGVHVLLEKPVATTVADGEAVVRAARSSTATLGVCFQNRFNRTILAIRDLLEGGTLGALLGGRAAVTWFRDESVLRESPVARSVVRERRRGAHQPGHPHPGPPAVVPR